MHTNLRNLLLALAIVLLFNCPVKSSAQVLNSDTIKASEISNSPFVSQPAVGIFNSKQSDGDSRVTESDRFSLAVGNSAALPWMAIVFLLLVAVVSLWRKSNRLYKINSRLHQNNGKLITNNKEVKKLLAIKERLFKQVCHEFKTPVTVLKGYVGDIVEKSSSTDQSSEKANNNLSDKQMHNSITRQVDYMDKLVAEVMELARLECGVRVAKHKVDLTKVFNELVPMFDGYASLVGVELRSSIEKDLFIGANPECVKRVFSNLISNSIKYNHKGGKVDIIALKQEGDVKIIVRDTGIGIAEDDHDIIFKQFGKVESQEFLDHSVNSTGLGLAIVKESIKANHGTLELKSEVGNGSEFIVRFPLASPQVQDTLDDDQSVSENPPLRLVDSTPLQKKQKILVVDDTDDISQLLSNLLCDQYDVVLARHGAEAMTLAKKESPALVITDIMMPVVDGFEFARLLKGEQETNSIPILFLSAVDTMESEVKALKLGAVDYIRKPFNSDALLLKIKNILSTRLDRESSKSREVDDNQKEKTQKVIKRRSNCRSEWFMQRLNDYIEKNIEEKISVEDMSSSLGMNRSAFTRKVKDLTSLNTQQYILHFRLKKAYQMLPGAQSVAEVAYGLGFNTQNHLSTAFSKQFGITCRERIANKTLIKETMLVENW